MPEGGGNEPLIVKGEERGEGVFTPTDGTTFQQAVSAFLAGRVVIIDYADIDSVRVLKTAIQYTPEDSMLTFYNIFWAD